MEMDLPWGKYNGSACFFCCGLLKVYNRYGMTGMIVMDWALSRKVVMSMAI